MRHIPTTTLPHYPLTCKVQPHNWTDVTITFIIGTFMISIKAILSSVMLTFRITIIIYIIFPCPVLRYSLIEQFPFCARSFLLEDWLTIKNRSINSVARKTKKKNFLWATEVRRIQTTLLLWSLGRLKNNSIDC